jgi:hypothetical protein
MKHFNLITAILMVAGVAIPAAGEHPRYAINADSIAAAISTMGIHVASDQVTLLTDVVSTSKAPRLRVSEIEKAADHGLMVRMECESQEQCLPFYARIRGSEGNGTPIALPLAHLAEHAQPKAPEVKRGTTATLLLDGEHVHVRLSVICLENGVRGQKIRVTAGDHKPVFLAEVVDGNLLKGNL